MATATTVGGARPRDGDSVAAEEAVQKYGQHLSTPAAQGESTVPLPKEFEELRQRTLALQEEEYWVAHSLQDEALEVRLQAVAVVSHGAFLHKFRKSGREKPHRRFVKVTGGEGCASCTGRRSRRRWCAPTPRCTRAASRASTCSTRARASR